MDWLEDELKQALACKEPSAGFDVRLETAVRRKGTVIPMTRRWLAAAAAVIVVLGAGEGYRQHQGRVARDQVMLAMKIAGGKLNRVQRGIAGIRQ